MLKDVYKTGLIATGAAALAFWAGAVLADDGTTVPVRVDTSGTDSAAADPAVVDDGTTTAGPTAPGDDTAATGPVVPGDGATTADPTVPGDGTTAGPVAPGDGAAGPVAGDDGTPPSGPAPGDPTDGRDDGSDQPDLPEVVLLRDLGYAGTGCPAGSLHGRFPADPRGFFLAWDVFAAEAGPGVPLRNARRNCSTLISLDYPEGWQFTVESVGYDGAVSLSAGTEAVAGVSYHFQGQEETVHLDTPFVGPLDGHFHVVAAAEDDQQTWSPCDKNRALVADFSVSIKTATNGQAEGHISYGGDVDGTPTGTVLALKWRRCE